MNVLFIKRAESSIDFTCNQGELIEKIILESDSEKQRKNQLIEVKAINDKQEIVAEFTLELSVKVL